MKTILLALVAVFFSTTCLSVRAAGDAGSDIIDFTLPANWQRKDTGEIRMYIRPADRDSGMKTVFMMKPVGKAGTLGQTFLRLWPQLIRGLFPNEPLQNKMVPLIIRNRKGVDIAFDGDGLSKNPYTVMLYLVDLGDSVLPFVVASGREPMTAAIDEATSTTPMPAASELATAVDTIALKNGKTASGPLFDPSALVGAYTHLSVGSLAQYRSSSGAYRGDASTGATEDIEFKADGTYTEQYVPVINGRAESVQTRAGKWKLDGYKLTIHYSDRSVPDRTWILMGLGSNRRGNNSVAYLITPQITDKFFIEMFLHGADVNSYFYTRK